MINRLRLPSRRDRWLAVALTIGLAVTVALALTRLVQALTYPALSSVGLSGPMQSSDRYLGPRTGNTQWLSPASAGQPTAWVLLVRNSGDSTVTVDSARTVGTPGLITWSTFRLRPGGYASGVPAPYHSFPATIAPHHSLRLKVRLQLPSCPPRGSPPIDFTGVTLHWSGLGANRTVLIPYAETVQVCPTRARSGGHRTP